MFLNLHKKEKKIRDAVESHPQSHALLTTPFPGIETKCKIDDTIKLCEDFENQMKIDKKIIECVIWLLKINE